MYRALHGPRARPRETVMAQRNVRARGSWLREALSGWVAGNPLIGIYNLHDDEQSAVSIRKSDVEGGVAGRAAEQSRRRLTARDRSFVASRQRNYPEACTAPLMTAARDPVCRCSGVGPPVVAELGQFAGSEHEHWFVQ